MPNPLALAIMGGTAAGGYLGYRSGRDDQSMDSSDKIGMTVMSAATGGVLGAAGNYIGWGKIGSAFKTAGKSGMMAGRFLAQTKTILGQKAFKIPKMAKGPLGGLALAAAAVGLVAAGSRTRVPNEREDSGQSETFNQLGSGVKERMGLLGATGDMVFGLNNQRHG